MSTVIPAAGELRLALNEIRVRENVRELDDRKSVDELNKRARACLANRSSQRELPAAADASRFVVRWRAQRLARARAALAGGR